MLTLDIQARVPNAADNHGASIGHHMLLVEGGEIDIRYEANESSGREVSRTRGFGQLARLDRRSSGNADSESGGQGEPKTA